MSGVFILGCKMVKLFIFFFIYVGSHGVLGQELKSASAQSKTNIENSAVQKEQKTLGEKKSLQENSDKKDQKPDSKSQKSDEGRAGESQSVSRKQKSPSDKLSSIANTVQDKKPVESKSVGAKQTDEKQDKGKTESGKSPVPTKKQDSGKSPVPAKKQDSGKSPVPANKQDSGKSPIPAKKQESGKSPIPAKKQESGKSPSPAKKKESGKSPVPANKQESGKSPAPAKKQDSGKSPALAKKKESGKSPVPTKKQESGKSPVPAKKQESVKSPSPAKKKGAGKSKPAGVPSLPKKSKTNNTKQPNTKQPKNGKSLSTSNKKDEVLEELEFLNQGGSSEPSDSKKDENSISAEVSHPTIDLKSLSSAEVIQSLELLAGQYKKIEDYPSQIRILDVLILKRPKNVIYRFEKLKAQRKLDYDPEPSNVKREELAKSIQELIELDSKNPDLYWELFDLLHYYIEWTKNTPFYNEELNTSALQLLKEIEYKFKSNKRTAKYLCHYYQLGQFYTEARLECIKAKQMNPKDPEVFLYSYAQEGENDKQLLSILKRFPKSALMLSFVGQVFLDKKEYKLAVKYFKKALKRDSLFVSADLGMASALFKMNDVDQALEYYSKACLKNRLKTLQKFRSAKTSLSQKSLFDQASQYQDAINSCINPSSIFE